MKAIPIVRTCILITLSMYGCSSQYGATGVTGLTPEQMSLLAFSQGYALPEHNVAPTAHTDREIATITSAMQGIAKTQGLVYDGHKATEGFVAVGKDGANGQMILILKLYRASNRRIAFQDTHLWNGADLYQGMTMRSKFLSALQ